MLPATPGHGADCGVYGYPAVITDVYDGDTVTADIDLGFQTRRTEKLRLIGIDAPEVRGEERPHGLVARDALRERILDQDVTVCTFEDKRGKYGRTLARIYVDGQHNINAWMVLTDHAEPYWPSGVGIVVADLGLRTAERAGIVIATILALALFAFSLLGARRHRLDRQSARARNVVTVTRGMSETERAGETRSTHENID